MISKPGTELARKSLCYLLGTNVSRLRNDRKWTQDKLAEEAQVSRTSVARIENGYFMPKADMLFAIADALEVDPNALRQHGRKNSQATA